MCYQKLANGIAEKRALSKNEKKKHCKTSRLLMHLMSMS
jgi:hypothetical protein